MSKWGRITAREILDSRGNPTVEVEITADDGRSVRASVPSGASKGAHEALELRDGESNRFLGSGVTKACRAINEKIGPALKTIDPVELPKVDEQLIVMDGTANKARLGANTTLAVSLAAAKWGALLRGRPVYKHLADLYGNSRLKIPTPMLNFINGGRHANNGIQIQEFMVVPGAKESFREALREAVEIFQHLKKILHDKKDSTSVGDEGGFAPRELEGPLEAMELILAAADEAGYKNKTKLALDLAASEFYSERGYLLHHERAPLTFEEMTIELKEWCRRFPLVSLEDPLSQDDWAGWAHLTREFRSLTTAAGNEAPPLLVGDDIFVTNPERLERGIKSKTATAILIKPNQIGTVTETANVVAMARENGYATIASHRSGETEDPVLAHVAVGLGTDGIKTGSVSRSERLAKYNELLRIEEELGPGSYAGLEALTKIRAAVKL
ncbi:MAG: phosphopyruvate hydratase [Elusimicrobia bacterium]|nr:phosphopyruvate hydratase [Elusimicrobiota bacterium]